MLLQIKLFGACNLVGADVNGKSDPYVYFKHGSSSVKSVAKKETIHPVWNQSLTLSIQNVQEPLLIHVYDKDPIGSDDLLGVVRFPLQYLPINQEQARFFKLFGGEYGSNIAGSLNETKATVTTNTVNEVADQTATKITGNDQFGNLVGKIMNKVQHIATEVSHTKPDYDEKLSIEYANQLSKPGVLGNVSVNHGVILLSFCLFSDPQAAQLSRPLIPPNIGQVVVRLISARNLIAADLSSRPSSDPYCIITLNGQRFTSNIIKDTIDPDWNQIFGFNSVSNGSVIQLDVWDKDTVGDDDSLGSGKLILSSGNTLVENFYIIRLEGGEKGENATGLIEQAVNPVKQNVAAAAVEGVIGGSAGKIAGQVAGKIVKDDPSKAIRNYGVVAISVTYYGSL